MLPREGIKFELPTQLLDGRITAMVIYGPATNRLGKLRDKIRERLGMEPIGQVYYSWFDNDYWRAEQ